MPTTLRRLAAARLRPAPLAALAPATSAASTHAFPVQSLGNRGSDVRAIQGLLRAHGATIAVDGVFGATTKDAVKAFQAANGLTATGIVRPRPGRSSSSRSSPATPGEAVKAASASSTRSVAPASPSTGSSARRPQAVVAFQKHSG